MTRHIPILSPDDSTFKKPQVYRSLVEGISEAIKNNTNKIKLC